MSMILALTSVSDHTATKIFSEPPILWLLLAPDDPEAYFFEVENRKPKGIFSRLFGARGGQKEKLLPELELEEAEGQSQDLDKAWHGIHYLLTGTAWEGDSPLNFLLKGGREVPGIVLGYGPARIISSQEVRTLQEALSAIDESVLRSRFDPDDMMAKEIYPRIWDRDPTEDDTLGYCLDNFKVLQQFISECVENQLGMVISIE